MSVLVVDDEPSLRRTLRITLESMGHAVREAATGADAVAALGERPAELVLLDLKLGRESGLDVLPALLAAAPGVCVAVITAHASIETAVEAIRRGASDYLPKPFTPDQLRAVLARAGGVTQLKAQVRDLQSQLRDAQPEAELESAEPAVQQLLALAFKVAGSEATMLLRGESGTGKGVLARAVHGRSPRAAGPFVTVHCPSLSAELLESELFGHAKGAYTGAVRDTAGKVAAAEGGTLFLDEIGDLPVALQPKLLRLVQDRQYERIGETTTRAANVRLVAATNRDLEAEVAAGRFREDLLYRLNVFELTLPPLRDRPGDIAALAGHLLRFFARQNHKPLDGFTPEAAAALSRHRWPGNLRELRNAVERGAILAADRLVGVADLPATLFTAPGPAAAVGAAVTLDALEAEHIRRVLAATDSLDSAAVTLGIDPSTLYRKRRRYGL